MERRHLFEREMQDKALAEFDDLVRIRELVDWEAFRLQLREIFGTDSTRRGPGRPPWDECYFPHYLGRSGRFFSRLFRIDLSRIPVYSGTRKHVLLLVFFPSSQ